MECLRCEVFDMEKVSVIIPVYNAEKFLYDCLESVIQIIRQT